MCYCLGKRRNAYGTTQRLSTLPRRIAPSKPALSLQSVVRPGIRSYSAGANSNVVVRRTLGRGRYGLPGGHKICQAVPQLVTNLACNARSGRGSAVGEHGQNSSQGTGLEMDVVISRGGPHRCSGKIGKLHRYLVDVARTLTAARRALWKMASI